MRLCGGIKYPRVCCPAFSGVRPNDRLSPTNSSLSAHSDGHPRGGYASPGCLFPVPLFICAPDGPFRPPLRPRDLCKPLFRFHLNYSGRAAVCQHESIHFYRKSFDLICCFCRNSQDARKPQLMSKPRRKERTQTLRLKNRRGVPLR